MVNELDFVDCNSIVPTIIDGSDKQSSVRFNTNIEGLPPFSVRTYSVNISGPIFHTFEGGGDVEETGLIVGCVADEDSEQEKRAMKAFV